MLTVPSFLSSVGVVVLTLFMNIFRVKKINWKSVFIMVSAYTGREAGGGRGREGGVGRVGGEVGR